MFVVWQSLNKGEHWHDVGLNRLFDRLTAIPNTVCLPARFFGSS